MMTNIAITVTQTKPLQHEKMFSGSNGIPTNVYIILLKTRISFQHNKMPASQMIHQPAAECKQWREMLQAAGFSRANVE